MNILVTGANGQLGNSIRKISGSYPNNYFFTDMPEVDITNLPLLENLMKEFHSVRLYSKQESSNIPNRILVMI